MLVIISNCLVRVSFGVKECSGEMPEEDMFGGSPGEECAVIHMQSSHIITAHCYEH